MRILTADGGHHSWANTLSSHHCLEWKQYWVPDYDRLSKEMR